LFILRIAFGPATDFVIATGSTNNKTSRENFNIRRESINQNYVRSLECCEPEESFVQTLAVCDQAQFDAGDHGRGLSGICFSERGCSAWLRAQLELPRTPGEPMGLLFGAACEPLGWLGLWSVLNRG
jgi:hypothetical protein